MKNINKIISYIKSTVGFWFFIKYYIISAIILYIFFHHADAPTKAEMSMQIFASSILFPFAVFSYNAFKNFLQEKQEWLLFIIPLEILLIKYLIHFIILIIIFISAPFLGTIGIIYLIIQANKYS